MREVTKHINNIVWTFKPSAEDVKALEELSKAVNGYLEYLKDTETKKAGD